MYAEDVDADGALSPSTHRRKRATRESLSVLLGVGLTLALLTSLLLTGAPVSADVTSANLSATSDVISADATYTLIFSITDALAAGTDTITVEFPDGFDVSSIATTEFQIAATSGLGTTAFSLADADAVSISGQKVTGTVTTGNPIGVGAIVQVVIGDSTAGQVTNGPALGTYELKINTSQELTQVTTDSFELVAPTISPLPGIVSGYNAADVLLYQETGDDAIDVAVGTAGLTLIEVGPGTYNNVLAADMPDQTIVSTDGALVTIIKQAVTITDEVTFDGFTLEAALTANSATEPTVQNCILEAGAVVSNPVIFDNCIFEVDSGDTGVDVNVAGATITNSTFIVGETGTGIAAGAVVTVSNNTFTGSGGSGLTATAGSSSTILSCTFAELKTAINITGGSVAVTDCTISDSTIALNVASTTGLRITNSLITGSTDNIMTIASNADKVILVFNDLRRNVLGIANTDRIGTVQAPVNWWSSPTGPRAGHNTGLVNVNSPLGATALGALTSEESLLARATYGVDVEPLTVAGTSYTPGAGDMIAAGRYQSNPAEISPQDPLADGYYNVYFVDAAPASNAAQVLIKLYNPDIDADTVAVFWNKATRAWMPATSQGVDTFGGFVWVRVMSTTAPSILNLSGTPFALSTLPLRAPAQTSLRPAVGATDVDVAPTFSWGSVSGATGYEFTLAEEIGQQDKFAIIEYSANTVTNEHAAQGQLKYSTTYNWRVRAVDASGSGAWTTGSFTTRAQAPIPPSDDFAILLEVNGVDIRQQDTIAFDEAGRLLIGIRISDVKRQVVLESIAVEATLAGQIVASVSESLEGVLLAVGDDYENTITLGEDKPMSFGLLGRTTGKFSGQIALTYSSDGSRTAWTVSKPIRIPGNPIGTVTGQVAAGIAALSVIVASWVWGSAASSTIAPGVNVPGEAVADLRSKLSDWVHGKLEEKARERVRLLIMKTVNSRMPKDTCPWCGIPLEHGYCPKCKKSAEQARREYAEHVSELAKKAAGVIEDAHRPITLQEVQSALNIIGVARKASDVLVAMNNAGLIRLRGIGRRKLVRWALGLGIIIGIDAVLWVTVGGWAALPMWALLAIIGGSTVVSWAITKALEVRGGRRLRAAG